MRVLLVCGLGAAIVLSGCRGTPSSADPTSAPPQSATSAVAARTATVTRIVDGDTIDVRLGSARERVRLIGIDTPESVKPDSPVECFGPEASSQLGRLIPVGTEVELVRDAEIRDPYDRLLAYVFRHSDGLFVNLSMAGDGYAGVLSIAPNTTFADDFRAAVAQARGHRFGLWGACPNPDSLFG